jgi:hypothetical protein
MTDDLASSPVTSERDWYEWHETYEDADSTLARRLSVIQAWLRQAPDQLPAGPVRLISVVAGQARDIEGVLRDAGVAVGGVADGPFQAAAGGGTAGRRRRPG